MFLCQGSCCIECPKNWTHFRFPDEEHLRFKRGNSSNGLKVKEPSSRVDKLGELLNMMSQELDRMSHF